MVSLILFLGCNLSYIVDLVAALHELASASAHTLLKLASSVRALLKPYGDTLIAVFFRVAHDGQSERGTTRGLFSRRSGLQSQYKGVCSTLNNPQPFAAVTVQSHNNFFLICYLKLILGSDQKGQFS